ncbi:MAG: stage 0 sporulation family protein [Oscillospiraceae bacterium]|nr:stage 0 sporulation family protein [Oscillospiraceae bacterium]
MTEVVSIKFNENSRIYFFDPQSLRVAKGDSVVVETANGLEYGMCIYGNHEVDDKLVVQPFRPVVRLATDADKKRMEEIALRNDEAFEVCQKKILDFGLDMKLVSAELNFDGSMIVFYFTSETRVDFRELVRSLASLLKTRIKLLQIGVRDEAKKVGGLGVCGKAFCCSQFLTDFHPVSIKMAKTQGLSLNPAKISGSCGRLMCCLKYEEAAYEDLVKHAPRVDSFVETPYGKGSVVNVNLLRSNAKVRLEEGSDLTLKTVSFDDIDVLGNKSRRAEYVAAKAEGRLLEAGFTPSKPPPAPTLTSDFGDATPPRRPQQSQQSQRQNSNNRKRPAQKSADGAKQAQPDATENAPRPAQGNKSGFRNHRGGQNRKPSAAGNSDGGNTSR